MEEQDQSDGSELIMEAADVARAAQEGVLIGVAATVLNGLLSRNDTKLGTPLIKQAVRMSQELLSEVNRVINDT